MVSSSGGQLNYRRVDNTILLTNCCVMRRIDSGRLAYNGLAYIGIRKVVVLK